MKQQGSTIAYAFVASVASIITIDIKGLIGFVVFAAIIAITNEIAALRKKGPNAAMTANTPCPMNGNAYNGRLLAVMALNLMDAGGRTQTASASGFRPRVKTLTQPLTLSINLVKEVMKDE